MELVLSHLEGAIEQGQGTALWPALLLVFQRTILRAHRCKFAQYLLWYLCLQVGNPMLLRRVILGLSQDQPWSHSAAASCVTLSGKLL